MKAVICECVSNGLFLLEDCRSMGLEPLVVFPPSDGKGSINDSLRESALKAIGDSAEVLFPRSVDELESMLSGMDIACIMAGSEFGIPYADMICERLGFPGNDPRTTHDRIGKYGMQTALQRYGLRSIRHRVVSRREDIAAFWNECSPDRVVIKPDMSVGSFGLSVCESVEDAVEAMETDLAMGSWTGKELDSVLIQEFIDGDEYIVNTVSRDGVHRITDMWMYIKTEIGGGVVPLGVRTVTYPDDAENEVASYALQVLDALGLRNGPSHMEVKLDSRGPVLIEMNARPMGGHFSVSSLDEALGHHVTDMALRSLTDSDFVVGLPEGIPRMKSMRMMVLVLYESRFMDLAPLSGLVSGLASFRWIFSPYLGKGRVWIDMTVDYVSSIGSVELVSDDNDVLEKEFLALSLIERDMPDLLYGPEEPLPSVDDDCHEVTYGDAIVFDRDGIRGTKGSDRCVVNLSGTMPLEDVYRGLYWCLSMMSEDGVMTVYPGSFGMVPYGKAGMTAVLGLMGLDCDDSDGAIVARRVSE